jgi:hypothetical protein
MERNNSFAMNIEKPEKTVGGILLVIGLIFIILPFGWHTQYLQGEQKCHSLFQCQQVKLMDSAQHLQPSATFA